MPPRKRRYSLRWTFERKLRADTPHFTLVAGVDEVGRGCWAGPVYAAAAILPDGFKHRHLNDSKVIPAECREELSHHLCTHPEVNWSIGIAEVVEIDLHNILRASLLAMRRAVEGLKMEPHLCLIDGNQKAGMRCQEIPIVDGDARCPSIAAASIIAKVARDRAMSDLAALYPAYSFENHKGYGTPEHQRALALHGPSPIHRKSFRPIRDLASAALANGEGDRELW